jgi:hypothetical protein
MVCDKVGRHYGSSVVKLLITIAISLAASAVSAAAMIRYVAAHAAAGAFWQHDPVAALWLAVGGPATVAVAAFAAASFACVTIGAAIDLGRARTRIGRDQPGGDGSAPNGIAIFAGTAFARIGRACDADKPGAAPLSLLRALRHEIWRVYAKRLAAVEILALAAGAGTMLARPAWIAAPTAADGGAGLLAAALLALVAIAASWLLLDESIMRLSAAMSAASGARRAQGMLDPLPGRHEELLGAIDRLVRALALRPDPSPRIAEQLATLLERLDRTLLPAEAPSAQPAPFPTEAVADLTGALAAVARAMHGLSAENGADRWTELEATVQAMSATLDAVAEAVRVEVARPRTVTDELEDLLDEISDPAPGGSRRPPPRIASRSGSR